MAESEEVRGVSGYEKPTRRVRFNVDDQDVRGESVASVRQDEVIQIAPVVGPGDRKPVAGSQFPGSAAAERQLRGP